MDELIRALIAKKLSLSCIDFLGVDFASHLGVDNSEIYKGTLSSSHQDVLTVFLDINQNVLNYYGFNSQEVVGLMAINGKEKFQSDICLAYSGTLSYEENDIFLAVAYKEKVSTFCFQLSSKRTLNIEQAILLGIEKTLRMINEI
ncbi:MAG: CinA family protein [Erysipelotrichaceae bacterium]|nr:CinA family protein [Erysipelotrichaceae bacterium]